MDASDWIEALQLEPHPEGGFYRETYHSPVWMEDESTLGHYGSPRRSATSIYFLLRAEDVSHFHRLKSDELWYFHVGDPLVVHTIDASGKYTAHALGVRMDVGERPQLLVPKGTIFGSSPAPQKPNQHVFGYSLVSCMVTPGFDYRDFELCKRHELVTQFPQHASIIERLALL
ncbi:cupin [Alicyclobacillus hesperidum subsp. aegles]|uniref:cupin domain-containing protein n=1 Tax=Alicyclobacillus hesperidum TaxID=89784 RepID=UPI0002DF795B|nr:cupin domain-containing protein [Alicyclobacillus hesperidum]KRW90933.1 hypothetical protein SD51_11720 [Alicyclobacillus tengchongensis]GLG01630.1 cupin [Alicyclobacillus hesperidum subsp. aegles]